MSEFKGTPGPWFVSGEGLDAMIRGHDDFAIVAKRHRLPAALNAANMKMIAAAPEMFGALEALIALYEDDKRCASLPQIIAAKAVRDTAIGADQ